MKMLIKYHLIFIVLSVVVVQLMQTEAHSSESSESSESSSEVDHKRPWRPGRDKDWPDRRDRNKFKCPSKKGVYSDIEDCSRYYNCKNWKAEHKRCSKKQLFDKYRMKCLPYIFAVCDDGKGEPDRKPKDTFKCPSKKGSFADIQDCSRFYVCKDWEYEQKKCPGPQLFDKNKKKCRPRKMAVCEDDEGTTVEDGKITTEDHTFTCPSLMGDFPHPDDCSLYYSCAFFIPALRTCPRRKLFDAIKKECKAEKDVHCGSRRRPNEGTTAFTSPTSSRTEKFTPTHRPSLSTSSRKERFTPTHRPSLSTSSRTEKFTPTHRPSLSTSSRTEKFTPTHRPSLSTSSRTEKFTPTHRPSLSTSSRTERFTPTRKPTDLYTPPTITLQPSTAEVPTTTEEPTTQAEPTGPPETDCDEEDLDCIIKETGETPNWFKCPVDMGSFPHPSSNKLFIFCRNWKPSAKKCGQNRVFAEKLRTCVSPTYQKITISG